MSDYEIDDIRFDTELIYQLIEPDLRKLTHEKTIERRKEVRAVYPQRTDIPTNKHA